MDSATWPTFDEKLTIDTEITIAIQVNGKLRGEIKIEKDTNKDKVEELAKQQENVKKYLDGNEIKKTIVVPNRNQTVSFFPQKNHTSKKYGLYFIK